MAQYCGPCLRDGSNNAPSVWCIECEEPLCSSCQKAHHLIKTIQNHHLVDVQNMTLDNISDMKISAMQTCSIHKNLSIDSYCKNHDVLCCPSCMTENHRTCERVVPLEVAAKGIKTSPTLEITKENICYAEQVLNDIRNMKSTNIENLHQNEVEIRKSLETLQVNIVNKMNEMSDAVLTEIARLKEREIERLEKHLQMIDEKAKAVELRKRHINFIVENGSEIHTFIFVHRLKSELFEEEKAIKTIIQESQNTCIRLKNIEEVVTSLSSIGTIEIVAEPFHLQFRPFTKKWAHGKEVASVPMYPIKSFKLCCQFELNVENCFVSGMCITSDDLLLLCLRGKKKLLVYDFEGKQKGELDIGGNPFNVDSTSTTDKAVVTFPDSSSLQIVDICRMEAGREIIMSESCWGITIVEDKVILAGGYTKIYILDFEGNKLEEVAKPENGRTYSLCFSEDKLFYCADIDFKNEKVYCITEDGEFVFCFSNAHLKTPTGLDIDRLGNVYVCDLDSNNVQRYSASGHFRDVLLKGNDITEPRAICFNKHSTYLALSNNGGKGVCVFQSIYI